MKFSDVSLLTKGWRKLVGFALLTPHKFHSVDSIEFHEMKFLSFFFASVFLSFEKKEKGCER